jgi:hypothetical protein
MLLHANSFHNKLERHQPVMRAGRGRPLVRRRRFLPHPIRAPFHLRFAAYAREEGQTIAREWRRRLATNFNPGGT